MPPLMIAFFVILAIFSPLLRGMLWGIEVYQNGRSMDYREVIPEGRRRRV